VAKIVKYIWSMDITELLSATRVHTSYSHYKKNSTMNPIGVNWEQESMAYQSVFDCIHRNVFYYYHTGY